MVDKTRVCFKDGARIEKSEIKVESLHLRPCLWKYQMTK